MDPANDLLPPPSSPTISSISSSDLDTESTGSFFHDRSTTLGTLMGVSIFRAPSQRRESPAAPPASAAARRQKKKARRVPAAASMVAERRRRWWSLCRDGEAKPGSLGEFLEVERRFGDGAFFAGAAEPRLLFAEGRVLPPAESGGGGSDSAGGGGDQVVKPKPKVLKMNVDGGVGNSKMGIGFVARSADGEVIAGV